MFSPPLVFGTLCHPNFLNSGNAPVNQCEVKSPSSGSSALQGEHFISNPASCASMCSLNSLWWMVALEVYLQEA